MDKETLKVFKAICEKALNTKDNFVYSVDIGLRNGEERAAIINYLIDCEYIEKVSYLGKYSISCRVTDTGMNYFINNLS